MNALCSNVSPSIVTRNVRLGKKFVEMTNALAYYKKDVNVHEIYAI